MRLRDTESQTNMPSRAKRAENVHDAFGLLRPSDVSGKHVVLIDDVNGGVAMAQLGVAPDRMTKVFNRWTGWLKERPETVDYLARPKGSRAKP